MISGSGKLAIFDSVVGFPGLLVVVGSMGFFFIRILLFSFAVLFSMAWMSRGSIYYNSLYGFIAYFCFTFFILNYFKGQFSSKSIVVVIIGTLLLLKSVTIYLYFVESPLSLPLLFIHLIGIISGFLWYRSKSPLKLVPAALSFALVLYMFFKGWDDWISFVQAV